jgi:hypothetical protein
MKTADLIKDEARKVVMLLLEKNKSYGDTANNPPKIFSKLDAVEGLCARIDDKLSRIKQRGITDATEDTVADLIGYLILLKVQLRKQDDKIKERLVAKKEAKKFAQ